MNRNTLKILLGVATVFFAIVAIVLLILGITLDLSALVRVILIIVAFLALILSVELGYFTYLLVDKNPNYFLYNTQTKRNISVQKLTFQMINSRMNRFLSGYATSEGKFWNDRVLDDPYLDIHSLLEAALDPRRICGTHSVRYRLSDRFLEKISPLQAHNEALELLP